MGSLSKVELIGNGKSHRNRMVHRCSQSIGWGDMNKFLLLLLLLLSQLSSIYPMIAEAQPLVRRLDRQRRSQESPLSHHNLIKHQPCSVELITAHRHTLQSIYEDHRWNDGRCAERHDDATRHTLSQVLSARPNKNALETPGTTKNFLYISCS